MNNIDMKNQVLKVFILVIRSIAVFLLWIVLLIYVDDSGLWHLERPGFLADVVRLGIVALAALLAFVVERYSYYLISKIFF